ncbi:MAG: membrane protein insertion efficiency factor YidD [bacterium]|nr:membrane protein insertion efficiency factor YidD [bacterium]
MFLIMFYQKIISYILKNLLGVGSFCRFSPSCSEYTKKALVRYGIIKGGYRSMLRFFSCQPFSRKLLTLNF